MEGEGPGFDCKKLLWTYYVHIIQLERDKFFYKPDASGGAADSFYCWDTENEDLFIA